MDPEVSTVTHNLKTLTTQLEPRKGITAEGSDWLGGPAYTHLLMWY